MKKIVVFILVFIVSYIIVYFIATTIKTDSKSSISPFWFLIIIALPSILGLFFPKLKEAGLGSIDLITFISKLFRK